MDDKYFIYSSPVLNERDMSSWISVYSDDIFKTMKESELKAKTVFFQSSQYDLYRPQMLGLLRLATEKHKLRRTTLHLATYLLDRFMDSYTAPADKLNLIAIAALLLACKIEEIDSNLPKFAELCKLAPEIYTVSDFKKVEWKLMTNVNFELIHPTAVSFGEYFLTGFLTLDDYHRYNILHNVCNRTYPFKKMAIYFPGDASWVEVPPYKSPSKSSKVHTVYQNYDDMVGQLRVKLMLLIDISLHYHKFVNARPSVIASACIAAVRQIEDVTPVWSSYLCNLTSYSLEVLSPFVEALVMLSDLYVQLQKKQEDIRNADKSCNSPDSGIVSSNDTKSESSSSSSSSDGDLEDAQNVKQTNTIITAAEAQQDDDDIKVESDDLVNEEDESDNDVNVEHDEVSAVTVEYAVCEDVSEEEVCEEEVGEEELCGEEVCVDNVCVDNVCEDDVFEKDVSDEDDGYNCLEYPTKAKRRRLS